MVARLQALLDHFSRIDDPREPWRVAYPLCEALLLVVCGTMADCDDYDAIAAWGDAHLAFLRRYLALSPRRSRARAPLAVKANPPIDADADYDKDHGASSDEA